MSAFCQHKGCLSSSKFLLQVSTPDGERGFQTSACEEHRSEAMRLLEKHASAFAARDQANKQKE